MKSMQIATQLVLSRLPLSSSQFPPMSFHHCFSVSVTGDGIVGTKIYTVINSEDIRRRSNDYCPRRPFLFFINKSKTLHICFGKLFSKADMQSFTEFSLHCTVPTKSNSTHWMNLGQAEIEETYPIRR